MTSIRQLASKQIQIIGDLLENCGADIEIESQGEELLLTDSQGQHFLLNYHGVTQQIWYSSALSGAHHFALKDNQWMCTRTSRPMNDLLSAELSTICRREITLTDNLLPHA